MKTKNKKILIGILTVIIILSSHASADGGAFVMPDYHEHVYLPSQKAAIFWDGENETLILSTMIKADDITDIAWVVPIQSKTKPEVEKGNIEIFYDVAELFMPAEKPSGPGFGAFNLGGKEADVTVIESKKVDIYDITILAATDANALVDWLNDNGYKTPESAIPVLRYYCEKEDFYFIANRINLKNKYKDLEITENDRRCAGRIEIPWYSPGYEDIDYIIEDELEYALKYDECENASKDAVKVLVELEQGVSTPIKIEFKPDNAFYPQKMSSVNEGDIEINIYVFSRTPIRDENGILSVSRMIKINNDWLKEKYNLTNEKYITLLEYDGDLDGLEQDSFFSETEYDPGLDPTYVSLSDRILGFAGAVLLFIFSSLLFGSIAFIIFVLPPFVLGYLIERISGYIKNRYIHYVMLALTFISLVIIYMILLTGMLFYWPDNAILLIPIGVSTLCGFYTACSGSKKWIAFVVLTAVVIYLILVMFMT